ncbi:MAG: hypothetical protein ACI90V_006123, partial [Bacillariaceae sp.]
MNVAIASPNKVMYYEMFMISRSRLPKGNVRSNLPA